MNASVFFKPLTVGTHTARYPIIQGAMAVKVSGAKLAAAVAEAGGIGLISSFGIGFDSPYFPERAPRKTFFQANQLALQDALTTARKLSPTGIIGVNILVATKDYLALAQTAAAGGADLIVTGAGLPLTLPEVTQDYLHVALVPIVADLESAQIICQAWGKNYHRYPDAIIVENCQKIGGHFASQCQDGIPNDLGQTLQHLRHYLNSLNLQIPIIITGGIWEQEDIQQMLRLGADGVQIGSRFITTQECDAADAYKQVHLQARPEDIISITSPVGKPARVLKNQLTTDIATQAPTLERRCLANCLQTCLCRDQGTSFCLLQVLNAASQGDVQAGLLFASGNVRPIRKILSVAELMASWGCASSDG
ncbi:nitronate monooxygenase family protein [Thermosynechococcaceae cyanobacterium BACA0444]|uniref:Nitronate monooxygenase family protein n=1 Tax=Pseudocalidococcus azoricus BACA0444 TaxID=2918990 RepID=A0AAE4FQ23_9CYAN|nr:nitronate monooxygenase family protein [Pseudocalidococcus azoricus]MDS3860030.1 nitronate monooxygenase family protein [Pseudocalidococcus azoricus BACA0444]